VPATLAMVWLGTRLSTVLVFDAKLWGMLILIYCFLASLTPVWALLQPRGYLGGFVLFLAIGLGIIGVFSGQYTIQQPAFKGWQAGLVPGTSAANTLFPFLFVTIACGACSGFHGLVCSGTTSKQIAKESHCHPVGYGAMLAEGFVAFIALVTIMMLSDERAKELAKPGIIYGTGIGEFMTLIIGEQNRTFAIVFGAMAFSTFVFDTLDVCTRLGRYLIQELTGWRTTMGSVGATLLTVIPAAFFVAAASKPDSYISFWTLFGASNQLLAALTLLSITVWLYQARRRIAFTLLPMIFVLVTTLTALVKIVIGSFVPAEGQALGLMGILNGIAALILVLLALYLAVTALLRLKTERSGDLVLDAPGAPLPAAE
ncbi:MAG TPA: carbon starvation CstA family protein, partial [bacterium]|nr:carbon starvation CstA family protein [bacterium]